MEFFRPKVFVHGERSRYPHGFRWPGQFISRVQKEARALEAIVFHAQVEDCVKLGLPQKRRRQLFIGTRLERAGVPLSPISSWRRVLATIRRFGKPSATCRRSRRVKAKESCVSDAERRKAHIEQFGRRVPLQRTWKFKRATSLTAHCAPAAPASAICATSLVKEGESLPRQIAARSVRFEFPLE